MTDLDHKQLAKLFRENPEKFEIERKRMIEEFIESAPPEQQLKLRAVQAKWDVAMRKAGSERNRLAIAQGMFWNNFFDVWKPTLDELNTSLNGRENKP
jgi:hypothetical protein